LAVVTEDIMEDRKNHATTGDPLDIKPEDVIRSNITDGELKGKRDAAELNPDLEDDEIRNSPRNPRAGLRPPPGVSFSERLMAG
jgi:hypothetical protein